MNTVEVRVKYKGEWHEINPASDIEELAEMWGEDYILDEFECPDLLLGYLGTYIKSDLPDAIASLENADNDLEVYEAYYQITGKRRH